MTTDNLPHGVAEAHAQTMRHLAEHGQITGEPSDKFGIAREELDYQTGLSSPRHRLVAENGTVKNVVGSVARFTWLVAGSDRLEDIAYYEDRVRDFTDDGLTVPGSSYGRRLFNAAPGLNQIDGVVRELKDNPRSRRAAAVVWLPEDAVRSSTDIPCTFGLFFHIREGELTMTTVMRSNNAFTLLPYNFFEFSMVGEMIAAAAGVPFGRYVHWAASMHTFESAKAPIDAILGHPDRTSIEMPPMPQDDPLGQAAALAQLEAKLRNASTIDEVRATYTSAVERLNDYWLALYRVLHAYGLNRRGLPDEAREVTALLPEYFRNGVEAKLDPSTEPTAVEAALFSVDELEVDTNSQRATAAESAISGSDQTVVMVAKILAKEQQTVAVGELLDVVDQLRRDGVQLAARSAGGANSRDDVSATDDLVRAALSKVREGRR